MFEEALYTKTKQVLDKLSKISLVQSFYLAGGKALALHLGHRKSIDLDFFIYKFPTKSRLLNDLKILKPHIIQDSYGTLDLIIEDVKVSFLEYQYKQLEKFEIYKNLNIASIIDIACMKLSAISSRGAKKDFVDLYFILQHFTIKDLINKMDDKYSNIDFSLTHIIKSLTYFKDADTDPDPDYIIKTNWDDIKSYFTQLVSDYYRDIEK